VSRIFTQEDLEKFFDLNLNQIDPSLWTCVIPAAGKGTRLGYNLPKILYPILGKSILQYLLHLFLNYCNHFVVVTSPSGEAEIRKEFERICHKCDYEIAIQDEPKGMAHAIWQARRIVKTPFTAVVWGDQICLRKETITKTLAYHQSDLANVLTFPTVFKKEPYIHFKRDKYGKILKVLQKRENEIETEVGENDCGYFCFATNWLFSILGKGLISPTSIGAHTKEINLLQLFPQFESIDGQVNTLRIAHEEETLGINTINEAQTVESILRNRA
jgi:bifunctional UDP-N-acetylglucosamine pyrophosphorylase / glucosamine-1-phosphate N-acetyltransferase